MSHGGAEADIVAVGILAGSAFVLAGAGGEYLAKTIDKDAHPVLRDLALLVTKCAQVATAAFIVILTSYVRVGLFHPIAFAGVAVLLSTPVINTLVQNYGNESMKNCAAVADQVISAVAKTINFLVMASLAYSSYGSVGGASFGLVLGIITIGSGAFSIAAFLKK